MRHILFFMLALLMFSTSYAETKSDGKITLYQQPDVKSAVVEVITSSQAIMPIFTQGEWTKVADPGNGNVGWVSNEALKQQRIPMVKTITQNVNSPNGSGYKIMQFGSSQPFDQKQMDDMIKNWQAQQGNVQRMFSQMLEQSAANLNTLAKQMQQQNIQLPMIIPLVVVPDSTTSGAVNTNNTSTQENK